MSVRDLLVHLDGSPGSAGRLSFGADLAARLSAHLVGLHVVDVPLPVFAGADMGGGAAMAELIQRLQDDALAAAKPIEAGFREVLRREGLPGEWRQVEGSSVTQLALHGRYADLVVTGQPDPRDPGAAGFGIIESALFSSGRPVLLLPFAGAPARLGGRALVAWNASREATRALHDALPLLRLMESVTVLTIDPATGADGDGGRPGADIAPHLARHGLAVTTRTVAGSDIAAGDVVLNEAADLGADLIVMGAYGHSRLRELMLGGVTRTLLRQMTAPVLMSH
ncbi:universal stress protein [Falsiroseomonas oryziterrae]|uniref:universal stress protein n=1 Tax=Falsiroseomonas oryziterrae TaxID=2911368 RepID=UPI001F1C2117|nr:universal stress protein [Roseomonas sp. NPKOSM-4]